MKTSSKIILGILSVLILISSVTGVFLATLDPNDHKEWVQEKFRDNTGRELALDGDIGLTLYPWFGLTLNQVEIANPQGFGDEPMFQAQRAEMRIKLLPMLRRHYEIDTVRLHGAKLNLVVNEQGVGNWEDLASDAATAPVEDTQNEPMTIPDVVLGGVDIQDAGLRFENRMTGAEYEISEFQVSTGELVYGVPIDLSMTMNARSTKPEVDAVVTLAGTINYDLDQGRYQLAPLELQAILQSARVPADRNTISLVTSIDVDMENDSLAMSELRLEGLGSQLLASVRGSGIQSERAVYETELNLSGENLALLFQVAEIEPLASQLALIDEQTFSLQSTASLNLGTNSLNVSRLAAGMLGADLDGSLLATNIQSDQPVIRGNLNASGPDLPLVVEVVGQLTGGRDSKLSQAGRELQQVENRRFAVDTVFDANLQSGEITVSALEASVLGAELHGSLVASEIQSDAPLIKGSLNASGPDLPLLMQIAGWFQGGPESALFQNASRLAELADKRFTAMAEFDANLEQGNIAIPTLSAEALGIRLDGNFSTRNFNASNGTVNGRFDLQGNNLENLMNALEQSDLGSVLQSLSVQVRIDGTRESLLINPLQIQMVVAGTGIANSPATLQLDAATRVDLERETVSLDNFTVSGLGLNASGNVSANSILESPTYQGKIQVAQFSPRNFLQQLNQPLPQTRDAVFQKFSISSDFRGSTSSVALENLDMVLDDTRLNGSLAITDFDNYASKFNIEIDSLNVDSYLPPESTGTSNPAVAQPVTSSEIPVQQIRDLNILGELEIGELQIANMSISELSLTLNAADGQVNLAPLFASLYEGSFEGSFRLSVTDPVPDAHMEINLSQVDLEPLLQDLMDASYVSGRGNVQLAISGSGADSEAIRNNLNGTGRISLADGIFKGVDVVAVLGQIETMLRSKRIAELERGGETAFDTFAATMQITDSVISTNDLLIKSPGLQLTGKGTLLDLKTETLGFDLVTSVDRSTATRDSDVYDIGGYSLPIACTGTASSPRCLPDAGEIIRTALAREVQQRVGGLLERALGGDAPAATDPSADQNNSGPSQTPQTTTPQQPPADPADELINRALNRIFN